MNRGLRESITFAVLSVCSVISSFSQEDFTKYIDPTIGNVAQFLVPTYPTMHLPNQMIRMFPVKQDYISDQVDAFPLQVISHRDAGILQMRVNHGEITNSSWKQKMNIDHDLEVIHPWYYSTYIIDDNIRVSFTPGEKCAIYKIEFQKGNRKNILIRGKGEMRNKVHGVNSFHLQETIVYKTRGIPSETRTMVAYVFGIITDEKNEIITSAKLNSESDRFSVSFPESAPSTVFLKYAVSYISYEQAKINFDKELTRISFDDLIASGKKAWEKVTNQIQVKGGTDAQKRTFYTSLYRTCERMVDINEGGKYFSGYDGKVHESTRPFYVDDWIWDTYRATHPLRTILNPKLENDMLNSYVLMYEQSGWMPTFPQVHGNHMCMNSYHSSAIFIDGYRKGLRDYNVEKAYEGVKKNLMEGTFIPWRQGTKRRPIDDFFHENGYFPALHPGEKETEPQMDDFEKRQPVPVTLGISYDFWTLGQFASELGKTSDYEKFNKAGINYKKLWHPEQRLFMPMDDKGEWIDIDPKSAGGRGYREYYDENNGWTYAWDVPHDIEGLIQLLGGRKAAEDRLDQMFREPLGMKKNDFYVNGSNSTGMVGQFSMGNEPSFHIPYLFNYFGAPWKTQKYTRFLLDVWFKDNIFGIPGDEDGGGMTAFVVFTSMGLYPVTPGLPFYNITSPVFEETTINLTNGKTFTVLAKGASRTKKYIQKAYINGAEINNPFITHKQIMEGGTLELILGELPDKEWGKDAEISAQPISFYVSVTGNDNNPGTVAKPFATLNRARDAVRNIEKNDPVEIIIREGCYYLPETLVLNPGDSGTEQAPITWRAAEGEKVILSGGKSIIGKWQISDGKIWVVDVPEAKNKQWNFRQLFVDGKRMTRARFPNKSLSNPFLYADSGGKSHIVIDKKLIKQCWGKATDAQINIVPQWRFFNQWNTIESVDTLSGTIHLENSELFAEIIKGNWFWIEGVKEELDETGEWFLDNEAGKLYYIPEHGIDPNQQKIVAAYLNRLVYLKGDVEQKTHVKNIIFKNIEFQHTTFTLGHIEPRVHTDAAIMFENANKCRIEHCKFENIGGYALWLHLDSKENVFNNCTVLESGGGGVLLTGARFSYMDESKLYTTGAVAATVFPILNRITNNTVKHCGKIRYYGGGVHLDSRPDCMAMAPGNYIAHNYFQDLSRNGVFAFRNQGGNVVEYNHIHDAMQTTIDGACIHFATMNHLNAPNYILNNYMYDIWGYEQRPDGIPKRHLGNGIFLDWATSNTTVKNNYIYNAAGESIKNIMGNQNLAIADNKVSETRIEPPFMKELGPGTAATNGIDMEKNYLTGSVIHYSDSAFVKYSGKWKPVEISGFWNLFNFKILEADSAQLSEITYTLPIPEDGSYQISILYLPDPENASNVKIQVHHAEGTSEIIWDMSKGDKFGFSLQIGNYRFKKGGLAKVVISNSESNGKVVANSVAFVKI